MPSELVKWTRHTSACPKTVDGRWATCECGLDDALRLAATPAPDSGAGLEDIVRDVRLARANGERDAAAVVAPASVPSSYSIRIEGEALAALERRACCGGITVGQALAEAIALMRMVNEERRRGGHVVVHDRDGRLRELLLVHP
jgi:hypothetical protein